MNKWINLNFKKLFSDSFPIAFGLVSLIYSIVPEKMFLYYRIFSDYSDETNIIFNRMICCSLIFFLSMILTGIRLIFRNKLSIKDDGYIIEIEYGNLFETQNCKKLINFDECFTTTIGEAPHEIKPQSICGQYLTQYPLSENDMKELIEKAKLKPLHGKSKYEKRDRYAPGTIVPQGEYLLMAFAKLDKDGLGVLSYEDFLKCLSLLWKEIDKYHDYQDVCIPVLGAGITRMNKSLSQKDLLNIIILSYKLSEHKIKLPSKLRIVCRKCEGFSLSDFESYN